MQTLMEERHNGMTLCTMSSDRTTKNMGQNVTFLTLLRNLCYTILSEHGRGKTPSVRYKTLQYFVLQIILNITDGKLG